MKTLLWLALWGVSCASFKAAPKPSQDLPPPGNCSAGKLTNACRYAEWELLRKDPRAAAAHLQQLCAIDASAWACFELGLLLSRWWNLPHDEPRALEAFTDGCNLHLAQACAAEALMREAGRGANRQLDRAARLHQRACNLGIEASCAEARRLRDSAGREGELSRVGACAEPCTGLDQEEIARVMRRRKGSIQYCYELAMERNEPAGRLALRLTIDAQGRVARSDVVETTDEPLAYCVNEALRDFQFPPPRNSKSVEAAFEYQFSLSGNAEERSIVPDRVKSDEPPGRAPLRRRR